MFDRPRRKPQPGMAGHGRAQCRGRLFDGVAPSDIQPLYLSGPAASELASVVGFLLQLGFREAGRPLPVAALAPLERDVAGHLAQLGLLLPFRRGDGQGLE